jgi:hypothetical protein
MQRGRADAVTKLVSKNGARDRDRTDDILKMTHSWGYPQQLAAFLTRKIALYRVRPSNPKRQTLAKQTKLTLIRICPEPSNHETSPREVSEPRKIWASFIMNKISASR